MSRDGRTDVFPAESITDESTEKKTRKGEAECGNDGQSVTEAAKRRNVFTVPKQVRRENWMGDDRVAMLVYTVRSFIFLISIFVGY